MGLLSKPLVLHQSCYEIGHTWTPSCKQAAWDVAKAGYAFSFKTYALLYLIAALAKRRNKTYFIQKLLPEILQSTLFLGTNACGFISCFCLWRLVIGQFYFWPTVYGPSFMASIIAILIERKPRRGQLAVYVTQVALQTLYRMFVSRGWLPEVPNGEVLLFSAVSAIFMYLYKTPGELSGATLSAFRFLVGESEQLAAPVAPPVTSSGSRPGATTLQRLYAQLQLVLQPLMDKLPSQRHASCRHTAGCLQHVIAGGARMFCGGWLMQAALRCVTSLRRPSTLPAALGNKQNLAFAAFLGSYTTVFRLVSCLLRYVRGRDCQQHGMLAGGLAGLSMFFFKSSNLAAYIASKLCELLYMKAAAAGVLPTHYYGDVALYSVSTALLFHVAVFECHNMTPTYWRFLEQITDGKFAMMDRKLLDQFGTNASKMFPDFVSPVVKPQ